MQSRFPDSGFTQLHDVAAIPLLTYAVIVYPFAALPSVQPVNVQSSAYTVVTSTSDGNDIETALRVFVDLFIQ